MATLNKAFPTAQAATLFDTPAIVDHLPGADELNVSLSKAILAQRDKSKGLSISNVDSWHSDLRMIGWGGEAAMTLLHHIIRTVDYFTVDVKAQEKPRYRWFPEMWANVTLAGGSNQYHSHPGAFWSAVYYVNDGYEGSDDPELGGELVLLDPRMPMIRMNTPDLRFRRPGHKPDDHEKWMRPQSGRLVIFPAWLNHAVRPYKGRDFRISIAVNLSAVPLSVGAAE